MYKRIAMVYLYCGLCCIQGLLGKLLEDVPILIYMEADSQEN